MVDVVSGRLTSPERVRASEQGTRGSGREGRGRGGRDRGEGEGEEEGGGGLALRANLGSDFEPHYLRNGKS